MGRCKVQLKRIDDKNRRQVTFSKRRSGLFKKAHELAILCDVDVALVVFSGNGRPYEFFSGDSLAKILDRYQAQSDPAKLRGIDGITDMHPYCTSLCKDDTQLHRFFDGQHLEQLSVPDLIQMEQLLDAKLRQIRNVKTKLMIDTVSSLHEREKKLREEKQLKEREIELMGGTEDDNPTDQQLNQTQQALLHLL